MKNWKFEYMNESQIAEIDKLWKDGHADALMAFGLECGNAGVRGYKRGRVLGSMLAVAEVGIVVGGLYLGKKLYCRLAEKKLEENEAKDVEVDS